jgi:hypothetical protein
MTARRLFLALLVCLAVLDAVVLVIRTLDAIAASSLVLFPAEGPVVYALWRLRHGYPLYELPTAPMYTLTAYNALFYRTYALLLRVTGVSDAGIPVAGRLIGAVFAAVGAVAQYLATRRLFSAARPPALLLALLAFVTWFGCALPGWWTFAIRPDSPAVGFALIGFAAAARGFARGADGRVLLLAASTSFLCAWMFKQSAVTLFAGTAVYALVWRRSLRELALLTLPFLVAAVLTLAGGGPAFRANLILAPALNAWLPHLPLHWFRSIFLIELVPWAFALYAVVTLFRPLLSSPTVAAVAGMGPRSVSLFGLDLTYPLVTTVVAFVCTSILLSKEGSALNHALELHVVASVLACGVLAGAWAHGRQALWLAAAVAVVPMIVFDGALLTGTERGRLATWLQGKVWGDTLHLASAATLEDRERLAERFASLPKPVYCEDEVFSLPWHATNNTYPAVMIDHVFYDAAVRRGLITGGVDRLFRDRYFAAAVLADESPFIPVAIRAGYKLGGSIVPPGSPGNALRILVRD